MSKIDKNILETYLNNLLLDENNFFVVNKYSIQLIVPSNKSDYDYTFLKYTNKWELDNDIPTILNYIPKQKEEILSIYNKQKEIEEIMH